MIYPKLEAVMNEKSVTRNKLSKLTGIAPTDIYGALNGDKKLFPGWKRRIADALGVSESDIFGDEE